ncbi:MAG: hypothetical protein KIH08_03585 [Candidatus Freyarchaeota archaeon]|nr:hypothetical protein [Candidatus Jordarchaeia archaeon]
MVIIHGPKKLDPLAVKIAEVERIPVAISMIEGVDALIRALRNFMSKEVPQLTTPKEKL